MGLQPAFENSIWKEWVQTLASLNFEEPLGSKQAKLLGFEILMLKFRALDS